MKNLITLTVLTFVTLSSTGVVNANHPNPNPNPTSLTNYSDKQNYRKISDGKAVSLAIKAVKKHKLFGGIMPQYSETEVVQVGNDLRVTFIRLLPPNVLGSDKIFSVELDAKTGRFVRFLGY